jgi:hypothetical protein
VDHDSGTAIVSEETFALARKLLTANKTQAPRRTIEPSISQGIVSCFVRYAAPRPVDGAQDPFLLLLRLGCAALPQRSHSGSE